MLSVYSLADNYKSGTDAGGKITTGDDNYISGDWAGEYLTTGVGNTLIGQYAGHQLSTGKGNILLGYMGGYSLTTSNYKLYITNGFYPAYGIFGDFSTGYFGINNTSPTVALDITGSLLISGTFGLTGVMTFTDDIIAKGDTTLFSAEAIVSNPTESDTSDVKIVYRSGSTGDPIITFHDSIGGTGNLDFTSDILSLTGSTFKATSGIISTPIGATGAAAGGFTTITASGTAGVTGISTLSDDVLAIGDTTVFSNEVIVSNATEADSGTVKITYRSGSTGDPIISFFDSLGGTGNLDFTSDILKLTGSTFSVANGITGSPISGSTGSFSTLATTGNVTVTGDTLIVSEETLVENTTEADSSTVKIVFATNQPILQFFGSDGDAYTLSINTSDAAVFTGAGGGIFDGSTKLATVTNVGDSLALAVLKTAVRDSANAAIAAETTHLLLTAVDDTIKVRQQTDFYLPYMLAVADSGAANDSLNVEITHVNPIGTKEAAFFHNLAGVSETVTLRWSFKLPNVYSLLDSIVFSCWTETKAGNVNFGLITVWEDSTETGYKTAATATGDTLYSAITARTTDNRSVVLNYVPAGNEILLKLVAKSTVDSMFFSRPHVYVTNR